MPEPTLPHWTARMFPSPRSRIRPVIIRLRLCFLAVAASASLFGQGNTGSVLGTVTDSTGGVVPSAKISVTNIRTGVKVDTTTDAAGNYLVNFLQPGAYKVEAEVAGFKKFSRENVSLEMSRQLRIDIGLETGQVTETVNIQAQTPLLETENGTLSGTIENRQVLSLPTLGRNPQDFRLLVPGVVLNRDGNSVSIKDREKSPSRSRSEGTPASCALEPVRRRVPS